MELGKPKWLNWQSNGPARRVWIWIEKLACSLFTETGCDVVPQIVFWNLRRCSTDADVASAEQEGLEMLSGFNDNLVRSFLDNDGKIKFGPYHVNMERAISYPRYQNLVVVD